MRKYLKFVVLAVLAVLILWYFGSGLNWAEVGASLRKADVTMLLLATFIICFGYLLRALRWRTLLAPITESKLSELFATTTVGFAAVFLIGRAGEVVRPLWLPMRDPRVRPSAALVTIGIERICDLAAIILLFALNLLWFRAPAGREAEFAVVNRIGLLMLGGVILGIIALFIFQRLSALLIRLIDQHLLSQRFVPKRVAGTILNILNHLAASLAVLRSPRELILTVIWTGVLWFTISIPTWLVILAFDLPLGFSDALFVMGWAVVGSLVPTPGGAAGAFHTATAGALIFLNVGREDAAAVAILMHLVYFAPALFFGIYYFVRGDVSWERLKSLVITETSDAPAQTAAVKTNEEREYLTAETRRRREIYE